MKFKKEHPEIDLTFTKSEIENSTKLEKTSPIKPAVKAPKIVLSQSDNLEIKKKLKQCKQNLIKSLSDSAMVDEGTFFPLVNCTLLILLVVYMSRVSVIASLSEMVLQIFEEQEWQSTPEKYLSDIHSISDLNEYVTKILLVNSFQDNFLQSYNYVAGVRFSLKLSNFVEHPDKSYSAFEYVAQETSYSASSHNAGEEENRQGIWNYSMNSFKNAGGFTAYMIDETKETAMGKWREMRSVWLDQSNFLSLAIEIIIHNSNLYSTLYYFQLFEYDTTKKMIVTTGTSGISPEMYMSENSNFVNLMVIFSLYLLIFSFQLLNCVINLQRHLKSCLGKFKNHMTWYDYLEVILVALILTVIIIYVQIDLNAIGSIKLPLDKTSFDTLVNHASEFRVLIRLSSLTCFLAIIRLVASLKSRFPSFGVLFETITRSKNDLLNFCTLIILILLGFCLCFNVSIGTNDSTFKTIGDSFTRIFSMLVGLLDINRYVQVANAIKNFLIVMIVIIFYFVLIKTIGAIVMSTYLSIKENDELLVAANAEIIKDTTKELLNIFLSFVTFGKKNELYDAVKSYLELQKLVRMKKEDNEEIIEKIKSLEITIEVLSKSSFITTIKKTIASLTIFLKSNSLENKETKIHKLKTCIKKILERERRDELINERNDMNVEFNFNLIKEFLIFLTFLIIFSYASVAQLNVSDSFNMQALVNRTVAYPIFESNHILSLNQIQSIENVYDFMDQVFITQLNSFGFLNNFIYLNNTIRVTVQINSIAPNTAKFSNQIIPTVVLSNNNFTNFRGEYTKLKYFINPPGSGSTFQQNGGISEEFSAYRKAKAYLDIFRSDAIFEKANYIVTEWVVYNANIDAFAYNYLQFTQLLSGSITYTLYSRPITKEYHNSGTYLFIALHAISAVFNTYFAAKISQEFRKKMKKATEIRKKDEREEKIVKQTIEKICNIEKKKSSWYIKVLKWISNCFKYIFTILIQFLKVLGKYYTKNFSRLIESISVVLNYMIIFKAFAYRMNSFTLTDFNNFYESSQSMDTYFYIISFNFFFLFLRIPKYFLLVPRLSFLVFIFKKLRLDILFFLLMYITLLFGFTVTGYLMLGHYHPGYKDISSSFISCWLMKLGEFDYNLYSQADPQTGVLFIVIYVIIMIFFLYTMFMSIITGYYKAIFPTYRNKIGFIEKIIKTISYKRKGISSLDQDTHESMPTFGNDSNYNADDNYFDVEYSLDSITNRVNRWLSDFETVFKQKSNEKILTPDMHRLINESVNFNSVDIKQLIFFGPQQWELEDIKEKITLWNTISQKYSDEIRMAADAKIFKREEIVPEKHSDLQKALWENTKFVDKIKIWAGNLNREGRVAIWTLVPYPEEFAKDWETLSSNEKIKRCRIFLKTHKKYLSIIIHLANMGPYLENLKMHEKNKLWLSLTGKVYLKQELIISITDPIEYEMVAFLVITESYENLSLIEKLDENLTTYLDFATYNRIEAQSWLQIEYQNKAKHTENIENSWTEYKMLLQYKASLLSDIQKEKLHRRRILKK